jgi:protein-L-isoaspartate(D-aspartate) O-methyltransferase
MSLTLPSETATARKMMVDSQLRPNKVTDPRLIAAMRSVPREHFLPDALQARAYADEPVLLGGGRAMPEPMVVARMIQLADLQPGEHVLVVGAGTGYSAAVLAAVGAKVTALEDDPALLAIARPALAALAPSVTVVAGALAQGCPASGPYDCIFIDGAVEELPPAIVAQLRPTGRLVMVRAAGDRVGQAVIGRVSTSGLAFQPAFDCAAPKLPAFRKAPAFVF